VTRLARNLLALAAILTAPVSIPAIALGLWVHERLSPWSYQPYRNGGGL
jgi:hypothetical protein